MFMEQQQQQHQQQPKPLYIRMQLFRKEWNICFNSNHHWNIWVRLNKLECILLCITGLCLFVFVCNMHIWFALRMKKKCWSGNKNFSLFRIPKDKFCADVNKCVMNLVRYKLQYKIFEWSNEAFVARTQTAKISRFRIAYNFHMFFMAHSIAYVYIHIQH